MATLLHVVYYFFAGYEMFVTFSWHLEIICAHPVFFFNKYTKLSLPPLREMDPEAFRYVSLLFHEIPQLQPSCNIFFLKIHTKECRHARKKKDGWCTTACLQDYRISSAIPSWWGVSDRRNWPAWWSVRINRAGTARFSSKSLFLQQDIVFFFLLVKPVVVGHTTWSSSSWLNRSWKRKEDEHWLARSFPLLLRGGARNLSRTFVSRLLPVSFPSVARSHFVCKMAANPSSSWSYREAQDKTKTQGGNQAAPLLYTDSLT